MLTTQHQRGILQSPFIAAANLVETVILFIVSFSIIVIAPSST
jgi:hypothetical protein